MLGSCECRLRTNHLGPLRGQIVEVVIERDGKIGMRSAQLGHGFVVLCLCLLQRDLIVAGVQLNQQRSRLDALIVVDVNGLDSAVDASGDRIQMAVNLRVVRTLVTKGVEIPPHADGDDHECDEPDDIHLYPASRRRRLGRSGLGHNRFIPALCGNLGVNLGFDFSDHLSIHSPITLNTYTLVFIIGTTIRCVKRNLDAPVSPKK